MSNNESGLSCTQGCWALAVVSAIIVAALLMVLGDWRLIPAIFACIVIAIILGALLQWLVCKPQSAPGASPQRDRSEEPVSTSPVPTSKESAADAAAAAREAAEPTPATAAAATPAAAHESAEPAPATPAAEAPKAAEARVKPSKALEGEAELASRKGSWKYEGDAAAPAAKGAPAESAPTEPAPAEPAPTELAAAAPMPSAEAPARLSAAREGGPDNLRLIRGVGPKLEQLLHSMGFFHFDQIASWTEREVAWVDENLEGFKGRVSRDNWVDQARTLAAGGASEFSQKVKKGDAH